ncbi:MAG: tRNA (adenosine(37)-N6)-dimethylallyltransferase MiaA, partial [Proteobacteria bacterium]|nr:tRNA (adenosine(37)-N6)-dimethylallyltransferase MiaA [Pseudomonadota bacterium]
KTKGWLHIHQLLAKVDPVAAQRIHPNDPQRIGRAYEVYLISGKSISQYYQQDQGQSLDYQTLKIIISPADRSILHDRIALRFRQMLQNGFVDEVKTLKKDQRIHAELPAMRSVGYRQVWQYLEDEMDKETFVYKGIVASRQLAKRQLTWLRKEPDALWIDPTQKNYLISLQNHIEAFLK